jgi:transcriptional regulator with XRE-family HTH domain
MREARPRFARRQTDQRRQKPQSKAEWVEAEKTVRDKIDEVIRLKADNTQARFSRETGVRPTVISQVRHKAGQKKKYVRKPSLEILWRITKTYNVSLDWVIGTRGVEMDLDARTPLAALRPALREELLAVLKLGPEKAQARETTIEAAVGSETELWEAVVRHFRERAEEIERRQRELQSKAVLAALQVLSTRAPGEAGTLVPVEFYPAGDPRADTIVRGNPESGLSPAQARSILQAFGESEAPLPVSLGRKASRPKPGK